MLTKSKVLATAVCLLGLGVGTTAQASLPALDLSEWQGTITTAQAKKLKGEVSGVILRVQYGSNYKDKVFAKNASTLKKAGVKFGVYTFSQYVNASDARVEARDFYNRAKAYKPAFYVNDAEQYTTKSGTYATATRAWASEMHTLTKKPIVLYSYRSFYNTYIKTKAGYDRFWLASYQSSTPTPRDYHLWQYTDSRYSLALGKATDANKIIKGSWFKGEVNPKKYPIGGYKVGQIVNLKAGKWYNGTTIDKSLVTAGVKITAVRTAYHGKSNQLLTVARDGKTLGILRAQDVYVKKFYHTTGKTKRVKVIKACDLYKDRRKVVHLSKGSLVHVNGCKHRKDGSWYFTVGKHYYMTANKNYVKLTAHTR